MSGRIPRYFIDDLLTRVDIVDLIDAHVPLKKTGANFVARCPFHSEKTPSFSVNRNKQFFHCFGCGASGNAIGFLMDFNHLDFVEAVEDLATFVGVDVPRETTDFQVSTPKKESVSDHYQLLEQVAAFYVKCLRTDEAGERAVSYVKSRGVSDEIAQAFMLGYAPDEWQALADRFDQNQLIQAGMSINKDGKVYDRFRGRVMYPIRDKRGRIVGFGGRVLDDSLPKYLNSPETPVFHKGKEVYGLFELLRKDAKPKRILIVEGYMDVIALAGCGIHYAVATLGTATSQAHLDLLFRFSSELVFCFDGDNAGRDAAWRAMEPAFSSLKDGRQIRIMLLPQHHDPDSLVREEGADKFAERVQQSQPLSDYFFGALSGGLNLAELEGCSQLINKAKPYLEKLPQGVFRDMMFARLKELTRSDVLDVSGNSARLNLKSISNRRHGSGLLSLPRLVIALLVQHPGLIDKVEQREIIWDGLEFPGIQLFKEILAVVLEKKPINTAVLLEQFRNHPHEKILKNLAIVKLSASDQSVNTEGVETEFIEGLDKLLARANSVSFDRLSAKGITALDPSEKELFRKLLALKRSGAF
ncbi:DNA primase [Methyloglobulus sp.]|uniref:DNA primase n=1 Tax=Methyloglobulus sp. TaxID=2518622 RepID=UPI003989CE37